MMEFRKDRHFNLRRFIRSWAGVGVLCLLAVRLAAQPTYMMQNALVNDCEGILTDSDNGPEPGQYDHNEDYTFTICVDQADEIIATFNFFATEATYDVLTVYDGPNTGSPVIAMLTGTLQPPPVLVATSGCITFHFTSDDNIVAAGWSLHWEVMIDEPLPPVLSVVSPLMCPIDRIVFEFDTPVDCDQMAAGQFTILGPGGPAIAQVNPLDCVSGELGRRFEVIFTAPLSVSGTYRLLFNGAIQDACGEWHPVMANVVFNLTNCPFQVIIELVDDACAGDCGQVRAVIIGGDPAASYLYAWNHTAATAAQVDVCTDVDISIAVTVTDAATGQTATAQYSYMPLENPVILNPVQDTICSSAGDHFYQASLPGGNWYSSIIPPEHNATGRYQFWRWNPTSTLNTDIVTYVAPNGCTAQDTVYVLPVTAGSIEAACLNAPDFQVGGGAPAGGSWAGPNITPTGVFSPVQAGTFWVNYTAPNGCVAWKRINVETGITLPDVDTICSSQEFDLVAVPYGGRWSGPGIVNSVLGRIRPWLLAPNQSYTYVYTMQGCTDTMEVYIQALWAGPDVTLCDEETRLPLRSSGNWSGPGIYLPADSAFDISSLGPGTYDYTIAAFGCTDVFRLTIIDPQVDVFEPLAYCLEADSIPLSDHLDFDPANGVFSGPGIFGLGGNWYVNPMAAGPGVHVLYFDALGCRDSFLLAVEPPAVIPAYSFCERSPATFLLADPPGGTWSGPGFLDGLSGLYDPQLLSTGTYPIVYTAPSGCVTVDSVDILLWEAVDIGGVSQVYCHTDTTIMVDLLPPGGTFTINGQPSMPAFNPAMLGEGTHELFYTRGTGPCASDRRIFISVLPPITGAMTPGDSICAGENTVVGVMASGGSGTLRADWDQGLGFGSSHIVFPPTTTTYQVMVTDGCSEPFSGSVLVHVYPPFPVDVLTGPPVCFEDTSFVELVPPVPGQYAVFWQLDTLYESNRLSGRPGLYSAEIIELFSGCVQEMDAAIPGPPPLRANFSLIPNQSCIDIVDNEVQMIDLSVGHTVAWIDFGDGSDVMSFLPGEPVMHAYLDTGSYSITLVVTNDLGCLDTLVKSICVDNKVLVYVPNVFSPNGDGTNDGLRITSFGTGDVTWTIFSRWGEKLFETTDPDAEWDGRFRGQAMDPGVYVVQVRYTDRATGESFERIGTVTLLR